LRTDPGALKAREFIFERAPFSSCHASTLVESTNGLLAAWFGGSDEGRSDVGIWTARRGAEEGASWAKPVEAARGSGSDGRPQPCWNPVLARGTGGVLALFYKVGPSPSHWWGMLMTSTNEGHSWSEPRRLPEGILGPIRSKPITLPDNSWLCGSSTEDAGWRVHVERAADGGQHWARTPCLNRATECGLIQPTLLCWPNGRLQMLCRSRQGRVFESWTSGDWTTWGALSPTELPNPNSGIDAVMLADGRALLVYNHVAKGRSPLNVAVSPDGRSWEAAWVLEDQPGEYSYPAVIQTSDGRVHVLYTWKRERIRHVVLDPDRLRGQPIVEGRWPARVGDGNGMTIGAP
jgi:predicted neuraminidase